MIIKKQNGSFLEQAYQCSHCLCLQCTYPCKIQGCSQCLDGGNIVFCNTVSSALFEFENKKLYTSAPTACYQWLHLLLDSKIEDSPFAFLKGDDIITVCTFERINCHKLGQKTLGQVVSMYEK